MQMLRNAMYSAINIIWIVAVTIILGSTTIVTSFFSEKGNGPHLVARAWARSILWVARIKVAIKGLENLPRDLRRSEHQGR